MYETGGGRPLSVAATRATRPSRVPRGGQPFRPPPAYPSSRKSAAIRSGTPHSEFRRASFISDFFAAYRRFLGQRTKHVEIFSKGVEQNAGRVSDSGRFGALLFGHCGIVHNRPTAYDLVYLLGTVRCDGQSRRCPLVTESDVREAPAWQRSIASQKWNQGAPRLP